MTASRSGFGDEGDHRTTQLHVTFIYYPSNHTTPNAEYTYSHAYYRGDDDHVVTLWRDNSAGNVALLTVTALAQ